MARRGKRRGEEGTKEEEKGERRTDSSSEHVGLIIRQSKLLGAREELSSERLIDVEPIHSHRQPNIIFSNLLIRELAYIYRGGGAVSECVVRWEREGTYVDILNLQASFRERTSDSLNRSDTCIVHQLRAQEQKKEKDEPMIVGSTATT